MSIALEIAQQDALFSFDYWPMDYKDEWPQDGEAKVYVDVQVAEEDLGIPARLDCFFFIGENEYTDALSPQALRDMCKQAADEFEKWKNEELLP